MNRKISDLLRDKKYNIVCLYINNDLANLSKVIEAIKNDTIKNLISCIAKDDLNLDGVLIETEYKKSFIMCCIYSIVSNPFNFYKFLEQTDFNLLLHFCVKNITKHDIGELAIRSIVNLDKDHILLTKKDGLFYIQDIIINLESVYAFLLEYSKGKKINIDFSKINESDYFDFNSDYNLLLTKKGKFNFFEDSDNYLIYIYKIKILSKQIKYYDIKKEVFEDFMKLLNHQNISIGWVLAKEMVNISKYFEISEYVEQLKSNCNDVFANESLWINILSILGILILKGIEIGDVSEIIKRGLLYDNEFVHKSSLLREHCLFLVWSLLRKHLVSKKCMQHVTNNDLRTKDASALVTNSLPFDLEQYFDLVVFVFILDSSYNVRRAAASLIVEFIGIFKFDNGYSFLNVIDKSYHKRLESGGKLIDLLSNFYYLKKFSSQLLKCKLHHYNHDIKKLAAYIIVKHLDPLIFYNFEDTDTLDKKISALFLLIFTLEHNDSLLDENFSQKVIIDEKLYKTRNSEVFIRLYLHFMRLLINFIYKKQLYPIFNIESEIIRPNLIQRNIDQILENLHFLLIKNMFPHETSTLCWILTNEKFNKKLLAGLRRNNESFILVNIRQKDFPLEKYKSNFYSDNLDIRIATYKAIKYMENPLIFKNEIEKGLNDYSTDRRGDISYKIRLESLYLAISLNLLVEKFIIRYLVDKSKFLRDMTCVMLREMKIMKLYDVILSKRSEIVNFEDHSEQINIELKLFMEVRTLSHSFSDNLLKFIEQFDSIFEKRQFETTNRELCYFESMLSASKNLSVDYRNEFYAGICSSIIFSDKTLSNFLIERIFDIKEHVLFCMENIEYPNLSALTEIFNSYFNK